MKRESFRSRLGFLLVSAGCAIGIGNVWRFPYVTGKNGGGYFVLFYILCLLIMGVPVLTMELAVGRASHKSAILAYKTLEKPKSKWHIHGWFCLIGCYLLMMYYTTVSGWMVSYFGRFLSGKFYCRYARGGRVRRVRRAAVRSSRNGYFSSRYRHRRLHRLLVRPAKGP